MENVLNVVLLVGEEFGFEATFFLENLRGKSLSMEACGDLFRMSVKHDSGLWRLDDMTFEGTDYGDLMEGRQTMLLAEASTEQEKGFVAGDPACFLTVPFVLDEGMSLVRVRYTLHAPFGVDRLGETVTSEISFFDGLRFGNGVPIRNRVTVIGSTVTPCMKNLVIHFQIRTRTGFIRCDPNNDGRLSIADAVWILNELFVGGAQTRCRVAADCDGDGQRNITDAVFGLTYLFLGGPAPPAPYPSCGERDVPVDECPPQSTSCP